MESHLLTGLFGILHQKLVSNFTVEKIHIFATVTLFHIK